MLNKTILVGKIANDLEDKENQIITLAVPKSTKNEEGIYETDFIPVIINGGISTNTYKYCHKGDTCGVQGRLIMQDDKINIIAEKISFLSSKKEGEE